jgi:hypothetical protein
MNTAKLSILVFNTVGHGHAIWVLTAYSVQLKKFANFLSNVLAKISNFFVSII